MKPRYRIYQHEPQPLVDTAAVTQHLLQLAWTGWQAGRAGVQELLLTWLSDLVAWPHLASELTWLRLRLKV